jgi:RimJ/RimL family protein N-acetyltransferase
MNRKAKAAILVVFCIALVPWAVKITSIRQYLSGPRDVFLVTLNAFEDATQWSPEYVEREFKRLKIGQSQEAVLKMLGEPLGRDSFDDRREETWRYTTQKTNKGYWSRTVVFDRDKRVCGSVRHYEID